METGKDVILSVAKNLNCIIMPFALSLFRIFAINEPACNYERAPIRTLPSPLAFPPIEPIMKMPGSLETPGFS